MVTDRTVVPVDLGREQSNIGLNGEAKEGLSRLAERLGMLERAAAGRAYLWFVRQDDALLRAVGVLLPGDDDRAIGRMALERLAGPARKQPKDARAAMKAAADRLGMKEFILTSRLYAWLSRQDDVIVKGVLGLLPEGWEAEVARMALAKWDAGEGGAPKPRKSA